MGFSSIPYSVKADQWGDWTYTSDESNVTITGYTGTNTDIVIPDMILNKAVVAIGDDSFYNLGITSVSFPSNLVSIGDWAFRYCFSLTNAVFPANLTQVGNFAFGSCFGLTSISIPKTLTTLGSCVFDACIGLNWIQVADSNENFSSLGGVLFNKNLTELIQCPAQKTGNYEIPSSVTAIMGAAFLKSQFESISIPRNVTDLGGSSAFSGAAIKSITIPSGVTSLSDHLLYGCLSLTNIVVCGDVTESWTEALGNCPSLQGVYFKGNVPTHNIMTFGVAFGRSTPTVYYDPWTSGWGASFEGRPTQINPAYTQWLLNNNFSTNGISSTTNDFDKDGMLNWQEYLAGTSPTNVNDKFAISFMGSGSESNQFQISWLAKSNVGYQVMKSLDLQEAWSNAPSGLGTNEQSFQSAPIDGFLQYADPRYAGSTNAFYRVNVVQ